MKRVVDIWVGLFLLLGFAALVFLAMRAGNMGNAGLSRSTYDVTANFDNIGGLKPRAAVRSAGVVVGRVASIGFDDKAYQARVHITMDSSYQFPKDSSIKILTAGLLGEQYIGIEAGGDEKMLADGDRVSMTQSAVVLENLIGQFLYGKASETAKNGDAPKGEAPKGEAPKGEAPKK
jgi:phospholipid/cholesterol/gamma-HCH transport system substrate-binding protein